MAVRDCLLRALDHLHDSEADVEEARHWLARTEILLDWIAKHPKLVEINCEAAVLLTRYRGEPVSALRVDYRGVPNRRDAS